MGMILETRRRVTSSKRLIRDHVNARVSKLSTLLLLSTSANHASPIKRTVTCQNAARFNVENQRTSAVPRRSTQPRHRLGSPQVRHTSHHWYMQLNDNVKFINKELMMEIKSSSGDSINFICRLKK